MTPWIILAVGAQFILAVVSLVDKYIVTGAKETPRPFAYAYVTCLMSGASIVIYAFSGLPIPLEGVHFPDIRNITFPTLTVVAFSFLAAYTFFYALLSLFSALRDADTSDVIPVVGAVSALCTFGLSYAFLGARLSPNFLVGLLLLAFGTFVMSHLRFTWQIGLRTLHAGLFFGLHYVTFKGLLDITTFDNAFFWSRIGFVAVALSLLMVPEYLERIQSQVKLADSKSTILVVINKILAGIGSILILKATELGDASVVQALGGLQFVFILIIGVFFIRKRSHKFGERVTGAEILHKSVSIALITLGFFVLFV